MSELSNGLTKHMTNEELFADSFVNLKQAFLKQSASQRSVATRVKFLIRSILVVIVTSLIFTLYLIYILTHQVEVLTNQLDIMSAEGQHVLNSVRDIDIVMMKFEAQMNTLPYINKSISNIDQNLSLVTTNVAGITDSFDLINSEVNELSKEMKSISSNIQALDHTVQRVNQDFSDVAKPAKRFNDFNPFNFMQ